MKRRKFLLASIFAAPLLSFTEWAKNPMRKSASKSFVVRKNESRFFGKSTNADAAFGRCMISSADTAHQLYIAGTAKNSYKTIGGPGMHIHLQDDEIFYIASGDFLFQIEDQLILGKAGDTIFAPRGVAHTYANPIENNPGELLTIHQPISPSLEKFYEVFSRVGFMSDKMLQENIDAETLADILKNNLFVGPPIDVPAALKKLQQK